ncbi:hypothetical protein F5B21DRAFT_486912 [Xylaria acuta]|nr:hypothetical protein F5B21DRAFT_486912 [Xylaria acuta]
MHEKVKRKKGKKKTKKNKKKPSGIMLHHIRVSWRICGNNMLSTSFSNKSADTTPWGGRNDAELNTRSGSLPDPDIIISSRKTPIDLMGYKNATKSPPPSIVVPMLGDNYYRLRDKRVFVLYRGVDIPCWDEHEATRITFLAKATRLGCFFPPLVSHPVSTGLSVVVLQGIIRGMGELIHLPSQYVRDKGSTSGSPFILVTASAGSRFPVTITPCSWKTSGAPFSCAWGMVGRDTQKEHDSGCLDLPSREIDVVYAVWGYNLLLTRKLGDHDTSIFSDC